MDCRYWVTSIFTKPSFNKIGVIVAGVSQDRQYIIYNLDDFTIFWSRMSGKPTVSVRLCGTNRKWIGRRKARISPELRVPDAGCGCPAAVTGEGIPPQTWNGRRLPQRPHDTCRSAKPLSGKMLWPGGCYGRGCRRNGSKKAAGHLGGVHKTVNPTYGYDHRSDFHVMCWGWNIQGSL